MSCKCQKCGCDYKIDFIVPDDVWKEIRPDKTRPLESGLLCGVCIVKEIEAISYYGAYKMEHID